MTAMLLQLIGSGAVLAGALAGSLMILLGGLVCMTTGLALERILGK